MNDHQMSFLASTHAAGLHAEARRQRLVDSAKRKPHYPNSVGSRHSLRFSLNALLKRATA